MVSCPVSPGARGLLSFCLVCVSVAVAVVAVTGLSPHRPLKATPLPETVQPEPQEVTAPAPAMRATGMLAAPRGYRRPAMLEPLAPGSPEAAVRAAELFEVAARATVCITAVGDKDTTECAGVILDGKGHVLTTAVPGGHDAEWYVSLHGGGTYPAALVHEEPNEGWALLRLRAQATLAPLPVSWQEAGPSPTMAALTLACTGGIGLTITPGSVTKAAPQDREGRWRVAFADGRAEPGGPILDSRGRLVGLIRVRQRRGATPTLVALPVARLAGPLHQLIPDSAALRADAEALILQGLEATTPATAMAAFRHALAQDARSGVAAYNLGAAATVVPGAAGTAVAAFRQAIRLEPRHPDAYFNLGLLSAERGDLSSAVQLFKSVTVLEPDSAPAWAVLGELYRRRGRIDEALAALGRAHALDAGWPPVHFNRGVLYAGALGERDEAARAFRRFLEVQDSGPEATAARRYLEELAAGTADAQRVHQEAAAVLHPLTGDR